MTDRDRDRAPIPVDYDPFAAGSVVEAAPSTQPQREIWTSALMGDEASAAFNQCLDLRLNGDLSVAALRVAMTALLERHDALRSTFTADGLSFVVLPNADLRFREDDLRGEDAAAVQQRLDRVAEEEVAQPFDLQSGPLIRARLCRTAEREWHLLLTAHHIICDGWSTGILFRELGALYANSADGTPVSLGPAPRFARFAREQAAEMAGGASRAAEQFWTDQYRTIPSPLDLPRDRPRPALRSHRAGRVDHLLPAGLVKALRKTGAQNGATLVATLLATFEAYVARITGVRDIAIGIAAAGQPFHGVPDLFGHCVNLLPVRVNVATDEPFTSVLRAVRTALLDAQSHQTFTFGSLLERLSLPRDPSRVPLVPIVFNLDRETAPADFGTGPHRVRAAVRAIPRKYETFEWMVNAVEGREGIVLECSFNADLFETASVRRRMREWQTVIEDIVRDPNQCVSRLNLLAQAEREQILVDWNDNALEIPGHVGIHDLVERQAQRTPDAVALVDGETEWTYADLVARANRLAHHLQTHGIGADDLVGICLPRTADLIASALAVLKAGGAYVPLDPAYPAERIAFMLSDSQSKVVITQADLVDVLPETAAVTVRLDADHDVIAGQPATAPPPTGDATDLAYVIYTSGSTGTPKGVAIEHRSTVALLTWAQTVFEPRELGAVLASTSVCFDLSVFEMFLPLASGGSVIIASDALALPSLPAASRVTLINTVPSAITELIRNRAVPQSVKTINLAGEPLTVALVREIYETTSVERVYDLYGPSEDTTYSTWTLREANGPYTIGRPIANTQAYVLDAARQPVPIGVVGEIYLGGLGLARGYLHRPDLTDERFVPNPFAQDKGRRLYQTGDLARWRDDGTLEFLGRKDNQVKLRGFRIELGEVEAALERHDGVAETVVVVKTVAEGDQRLIAYVVPAAEGVSSPTELRTFLRAIVPEYMIPANFVTLDAIPLTPNGKVDRRALPDDVGAPSDASRPFVAPQTELEITIAEVWKSALNVARVGRSDDFFELGGHSILAARVAVEMQERLGVGLSMARLFEASTVERLAAHVEMLRQLRMTSQPEGNAPKTQEIAF